VGWDVERLAQWWTQAADEARLGLVERISGQKTPQKGDPSRETLYYAIFLAESCAGEVERR
jgi:hypothetical protein